MNIKEPCIGCTETLKCLYHYDEFQTQDYKESFLEFLTDHERNSFEIEKQNAVEKVECVYKKYNNVASNRISLERIKYDLVSLITNILGYVPEVKEIDLFFKKYNEDKKTLRELQFTFDVLRNLKKVKDAKNTFNS